MIAVVTGSSGFIGSHLVDALLARGATVRALVRAASPLSSRRAEVEYATLNLLDDLAVRACPIWNDATHVFHVGGVTKRRTLAQFREGNVIPTANILAALAAHALPPARFVLVSSQAAAGPAPSADAPVTEDDVPQPIEAYGRSKREAEDATRRFSERVPVTIIRPGAVYGPRDVDFLNVFKQAVQRVAFHAAPRTQLMSVVYVRDLVAAILSAAESPATIGKTYFAAAEEAVSWSRIYGEVATLAGVRSLELQLPGPALALAGRVGSLFSLLTGRPVLMNSNKVMLARPPFWLCDSGRIRRDIGWTAQTPLRDGLRETYLWYRRAGWLRAGSVRDSKGDTAMETRS